MPRVAGDALLKVTLNLFEADVEWFKRRHGQGWSEILRAVVHKHVRQASVVERAMDLHHANCRILFGEQTDEQ